MSHQPRVLTTECSDPPESSCHVSQNHPLPPTVKGTGGKTLNTVTPQSPHVTSLRTLPPPTPHCQRDWRKDIECSDPPESSCHVSQNHPPPPPPTVKGTGGKTLNAVTPESSCHVSQNHHPPHCQRDWRKDIECSDPPESSCHVSQTPPPPPTVKGTGGKTLNAVTPRVLMPRLSEPPPPPTVKGTGGKTLNAVTPRVLMPRLSEPPPPPPHCQRDWRKDIECSDPQSPHATSLRTIFPPPPPLSKGLEERH